MQVLCATALVLFEFFATDFAGFCNNLTDNNTVLVLQVVPDPTLFVGAGNLLWVVYFNFFNVERLIWGSGMGGRAVIGSFWVLPIHAI